MSCDIIIPVWNQFKFTKDCIESIKRHTRYPHRLIVIDNGSDPKTARYLKGLTGQLKADIIRNDENLGFVRAVNQGLKISKAPYICVLNNDTVVTDGWLAEMIAIASSNKDIGLVNPSSNNLGQHPGGLTVDKYAERLKRFRGQYIEMGACIGFCMLIKRGLFERIGYLDEIFKEGNFDDTDYSRKAEKDGYISVRAKGAYVHHRMKASFLRVKGYEESFRRNQEIYNRRWGKPKRLLYIVTKDHGRLFGWMKEDVLKKARGGNWVWLFFRKHKAFPRISEHSNMKIVGLPPVFFELNCLFRIVKKKKRFDSIYADDPELLERIERYAKFHNAETFLMGG